MCPSWLLWWWLLSCYIWVYVSYQAWRWLYNWLLVLAGGPRLLHSQLVQGWTLEWELLHPLWRQRIPCGSLWVVLLPSSFSATRCITLLRRLEPLQSRSSTINSLTSPYKGWRERGTASVTQIQLVHKTFLKNCKEIGMYKKAKKQVESIQYFDPSEFAGDQHF